MTPIALSLGILSCCCNSRSFTKSDRRNHATYGARALVSTKQQDESANLLNEVRNGFIHFFPRTSAITATQLVAMVRDCVAVISFLGIESESILWPTDVSLCSAIRNLISTIEEQVTNLEKMLPKAE